MSQSNLMKVVGRVNGELVTIEGRLRDSGWALIMPEAPGEVNTSPPAQSPLSNMMRWVTGKSSEALNMPSDARLPRCLPAVWPTGAVQLGQVGPEESLLCVS